MAEQLVIPPEAEGFKVSYALDKHPLLGETLQTLKTESNISNLPLTISLSFDNWPGKGIHFQETNFVQGENFWGTKVLTELILGTRAVFAPDKVGEIGTLLKMQGYRIRIDSERFEGDPIMRDTILSTKADGFISKVNFGIQKPQYAPILDPYYREFYDAVRAKYQISDDELLKLMPLDKRYHLGKLFLSTQSQRYFSPTIPEEEKNLMIIMKHAAFFEKFIRSFYLSDKKLPPSATIMLNPRIFEDLGDIFDDMDLLGRLSAREEEALLIDLFSDLPEEDSEDSRS